MNSTFLAMSWLFSLRIAKYPQVLCAVLKIDFSGTLYTFRLLSRFTYALPIMPGLKNFLLLSILISTWNRPVFASVAGGMTEMTPENLLFAFCVRLFCVSA